MYTQCPACEVAFRVTADVLQQARGRVRCGNCREAFNALDHLSESAPARRAPAPVAPDRGTEEKDRALMDTLNQLAGTEEIRIEDTGIEWRVVDEDDETARPEQDEEAVDGDDEAAGDVATPESDDESMPVAAAESGETEEPRYDDNTPLPEDLFDDDVEPPEREAPLRRAEDFAPAFEVDESQAALELGDAGDWADLLGEVDEEPEDAAVDGSDDSPQDAAAVEAAQGEAAGDDDAEAEVPVEDEGEEPGDVEDDESIPQLAADADAEAPEQEADFYSSRFTVVQDEDGDFAITEDGDEAWDDATDFEAVDTDADAEEVGRDSADRDEADVEPASSTFRLVDQESAAEDGDIEIDDDPSGEYEIALDAAGIDDERDEDDEGADEPPEIPEDLAAMSARLKIDPAVLQALEDDELAATMTNADGSPLIETIIMEGDAVRDALDEEHRSNRTFAAEGDPVSLFDTYISSRTATERPRTSRTLMGVGIVVLLLALSLQFVHNERQRLATHPLFDRTAGAVYRALGVPVTPDWDIRGWQFEATSGSTAMDSELLTISSRLSNRSSRPLPYPLVHVSLTDRYEEVIGSRILEPEQYLGDDTETGRPVPAGDDFTATITVAAASEVATGFKLNVCYREIEDRVRCAIEDFKEP